MGIGDKIESIVNVADHCQGLAVTRAVNVVLPAYPVEQIVMLSAGGP